MRQLPRTLLALAVLAAAAGLLSAVRGAPELETVPATQNPAVMAETIGL